MNMDNEPQDMPDPTPPAPSSRSGRTSRRTVSRTLDEFTLHQYLEGRLSTNDRQEVEEALRGDAAARRTLDALREEAKLIRNALETRSEPSKRLGDKVLATIHNEERFRQNALRNRRLRRQIMTAVAVAATVILCVWLVRPRDSMGTVVSGTQAVLVTRTGERRAMDRDARFYEGDAVVTSRGQFVRLQLAQGALLDLDEQSKISIEKKGSTSLPATLRLHAGRMGVDLREAHQPVKILLPQGAVTVPDGSTVDVWLPQPAGAVWPEALEPHPTLTSNTENAAEEFAVVTALKGSSFVSNSPEGGEIAVAAGTRTILKTDSKSTRPVQIGRSMVLETRSGNSWHSQRDGSTPRGMASSGLFEKVEFGAMGQRLGLLSDAQPAVAAALKALDDGMAAAHPTERAEKLAAGQQALRVALDQIEQGDIQRRIGRTIEGLAHMQRGRALIAGQKDDSEAATGTSSPRFAFTAARVAFDEALKESLVPSLQPTAPVRSADGATDLRDLTPLDQSNLIATLHRPVAMYWAARSVEGSSDASEAAKEFAAVRKSVGPSVEEATALLGEALCHKLAGRRSDALLRLQQVLAVSPAASEEPARRRIDGLRQAALVALTDLYVAGSETEKARQAAEDFWLLYPLETASPAARKIQALLSGHKLTLAREALQAGKFETAAMQYEEVLEKAGATATFDARLEYLEALVGLKDANRAAKLAAELAPAVTQEKLAAFEAVQEKLKVLSESK